MTLPHDRIDHLGHAARRYHQVSMPRPRVVLAAHLSRKCGHQVLVRVLRQVVHPDPHPALYTQCPERGRGAAADDPAVVDEGDGVAQGLRLGHVVGSQEDRPTLAAQLAHQGAELVRRDRVHPDGRFVEQQDRRVGDQATREVKTLFHPAGEGLDELGSTRTQPQPVEEGIHPSRGVPPRDSVHGAPELQVLPSGEPAVEAPVTAEDDPDQSADLLRVVEHVIPMDGDRAGRRRQDGARDPAQSRLPGAVGPEQPVDPADRQLEVDAIQGRAVGSAADLESAGHAIGMQCEVSHGHHPDTAYSRGTSQ